MIWNETKECMSRDEMRALQGARLVKLVDRVYHNVEYYRKKMQAVGLEPGDIRGLEDLTKLPFTTKDDLRDTYPFGMFAVPNSQIVRIHASSGTTGKATVVGYTRRDIDMWSECVARCITMAGLGREDIIQVAYFKATHGKRFFKMAPFHHHLERCGWSEAKIVAVFSAVTLVCCVLAYLAIQGRR